MSKETTYRIVLDNGGEKPRELGAPILARKDLTMSEKTMKRLTLGYPEEDRAACRMARAAIKRAEGRA